ncbi:hypothetical protein EU421_22980, partial [Salmonella enterica subsp. enterica serovar Nigeria]|nr:hypothetical protein [Salmonella enterica subsp. enterica serovar Nigeria]
KKQPYCENNFADSLPYSLPFKAFPRFIGLKALTTRNCRGFFFSGVHSKPSPLNDPRSFFDPTIFFKIFMLRVYSSVALDSTTIFFYLLTACDFPVYPAYRLMDLYNFTLI